jgi:hypothetical protein
MVDTPSNPSPKFAVSDGPAWAETGAFGLRQKASVDYRQLSRTGLNNLNGMIQEESHLDLQGWRGCRTYKTMVESDAVIGGIYYTFDKLMRQVKWSVERASDHPGDQEAAKFLEEVIEDMNMSWSDFISEVGTNFIYGFSAFEIDWKQRGGHADAAWLNSKHSDGRIGIRNLSIISQDSCYLWPMDEMGSLLGVEQMVPWTGTRSFVPFNKMLLFTTTRHKGSPLGASLLRPAYRAWMLKRGVENSEAAGIEREATGLPIIWAPDYITAEQTPEAQQQMQQLREIGSNIRRNTQEGMVMPLRYDERGNKMFQVELLQSGGMRQFDSDKTIRRHDESIVNSVQAGFMLLGQGGSGGSFAMHSNKSELWAQGVSALVDSIEEVLNRYLVPRLFRLNNFAVTDYPKIKHGPVGNVDLKEVGEFLRNVAGAGLAPPPDKQILERLMEMANLPMPIDSSRETPPDPMAGLAPPTGQLHDEHSGTATTQEVHTEDTVAAHRGVGL